jgi:HAD superfamily hydrolase (TIGR01509 family)
MKTTYGLIFDVDGLIANTEPLNARVTIHVLEDMFGLAGLKPEDFAAGIGRGAEAYTRIGAKAKGLDLTDEQVTAAAGLRERYLAEAINREGVPAFPGVLELMDAALQRPDLRLAIATSASGELAQAMLEATGVPYRRMVVVNGEQVKGRKPDPEIFLLAAKEMGIPPARCVVFEDAPSGVQAAKAAGARCIAVTNSAPAEALADADLIVRTLSRVNLRTILSVLGQSPPASC